MTKSNLAQQLVSQNKVGKSSETSWVVVSNATYSVRKLVDGFVCERIRPKSTKLCLGWKFCRGERINKTCKHVEAVKIFEVKNK